MVVKRSWLRASLEGRARQLGVRSTMRVRVVW